MMRIESAVFSVSWIPSEAIAGISKLPFATGVAHYDDPPPDLIDDVKRFCALGGCRFANELRAWIEVESGRIVGHGQGGEGSVSGTRLRLGHKDVTFPPIAFPEIRPDPEVRADSVRFVQTAGGRTSAPAPRLVKGASLVRVEAPLAWSTLGLTLNADGSSEFELIGASAFPRHWIYDDSGRLVAKSATIDFKQWWRTAFDARPPWGSQDSEPFVTAAESAHERYLARLIMSGGPKPRLAVLRPGEELMREGEAGHDLLLLLDGVVEVAVGDQALGQIGPGAILGERAVIEGGRRTATVRAVTACRVAWVPGDRLDPVMLAELSETHKREEGA